MVNNPSRYATMSIDVSNIQYDRIFNQMPVVRFLIECRNDSYYVIAANDRAVKFFDQKKEKIIGYAIDNLFVPTNAKRMADSFKACIDKKSPVTVPSLPHFPGHIRVPGFWVNPIFNDGDEIVCL